MQGTLDVLMNESEDSKIGRKQYPYFLGPASPFSA